MYVHYKIVIVSTELHKSHHFHSLGLPFLSLFFFDTREDNVEHWDSVSAFTKSAPLLTCLDTSIFICVSKGSVGGQTSWLGSFKFSQLDTFYFTVRLTYRWLSDVWHTDSSNCLAFFVFIEALTSSSSLARMENLFLVFRLLSYFRSSTWSLRQGFSCNCNHFSF